MPGTQESRLQATSLSIVIPTHQTRELTLACLASVIGHCPGAEVLVVDDASTDGTAEAIADSYPRVRLLRQPSRAGFTASVNRGLHAAHHDTLLVLNSDTQVLPGSLSALGEGFGAADRLGIVGAQLLYPDGTPQWSGGRSPGLVWLLLLAAGLPPLLARLPGYRRLRPVRGHGGGGVDWVTGAAMALRREVWERVGPFDERFRFYAQDLDLCLRAKAAGWRVAVLPDFRVVHHHGATVGLREATIAGADPQALWIDLARWAQKQGGDGWGRRARLALRTGARLRILGRRGLVPLIAPERRAAFRGDTEVLRRAERALGREAEVATAPAKR